MVKKKDELMDKARLAKDKIVNNAYIAKEKIEDAARKAGKYIDKNPRKAAAIAAGVGVAITAVLMASRKKKGLFD